MDVCLQTCPLLQLCLQEPYVNDELQKLQELCPVPWWGEQSSGSAPGLRCKHKAQSHQMLLKRSILSSASSSTPCLKLTAVSFFSSFLFFIFNVNACKQVLQTAHPSVRQSIWLSPSSWKNEVWQALVTLIKPLQGARKGALGWGAAEGFRAHSYNPGLCQREAALYLVVVWCWIAASSCCVSSQPIVLIILNSGVQIKALLGFWTVLVLQHCLSSLERPGDAEPLWSIAREMRIWAVDLGNGNLHPSLGAAVVIPSSY